MTFELVTVQRKTNPTSSSVSPLVIIVYIFCASSVGTQVTASVHLAHTLVAMPIYIFLELASPALTSFDAFLPGGFTVGRCIPIHWPSFSYSFFSDVLPEFTSS